MLLDYSVYFLLTLPLINVSAVYFALRALCSGYRQSLRCYGDNRCCHGNNDTLGGGHATDSNKMYYKIAKENVDSSW